MVHRVQTSSSFPSGHVFPGGNLDPKHDGEVPVPSDPKRHTDCVPYRIGAIREAFEESGILLAKDASGRLLSLPESVRERGRKDIYEGKVRFLDWVAEQGGAPDVDGLLPFTRWITPVEVPRRFTTQMYVYFLPLSGAWESADGLNSVAAGTGKEVVIPHPTHDGGKEHTAARFDAAGTWLEQSESGEILVFPPQYYLLWHVSMFLKAAEKLSDGERQAQRDALREFLNDEGERPKWAEKVIGPKFAGLSKDGSSIFLLDGPGQELRETGRGGDKRKVVLMKNRGAGSARVQVRLRDEVMEELQGQEGQSKM
jgi:8-oxo-dGTP pyrophosphatase MutT (NUDIX family)